MTQGEAVIAEPIKRLCSNVRASAKFYEIEDDNSEVWFGADTRDHFMGSIALSGDRPIIYTNSNWLPGPDEGIEVMSIARSWGCRVKEFDW